MSLSLNKKKKIAKSKEKHSSKLCKNDEIFALQEYREKEKIGDEDESGG